jgi:hypothetical protein
MVDKFNELIEEIEGNLYQLIGQIDYGEISNIDTYFASLTESIQELSEFGYVFSIPPESLSEALKAFANIINIDDLIKLSDRMESFFEGAGSTDDIDDDEIEKWQNRTIELEEEFLKFTRDLKEYHKEHHEK